MKKEAMNFKESIEWFIESLKANIMSSENRDFEGVDNQCIKIIDKS